MSQPPDLEARVARLETQVHDLQERVRQGQQDAATARVLAGGADRDVTEMRREIREFREQNTRLHNATREDLTDLRSQMNVLRSQMNDGFARVDERFARVDDGFAEMRGKFDATAAGLQQITDMLNTLISQEGDQ
jgi:chromosome segregation ATPase